MAADSAHGRPMALLVVLLCGSFVLMILSGLFYMAGLPEDWARMLFLATVIVWTVLGIAVIVDGLRTTAALARERLPGQEQRSLPGKDDSEGKSPPAGGGAKIY